MGALPEEMAAITQEGTSTSTSGYSEEIRTIFVLGFPSDVKEREFCNLLKWWPGYEACMMDFKGEQPLGFARFKTAAQARTARDMIQNVVLDREGKSRMTLRAEMARKNLYLKPSFGRQNGNWNRRSTSGTQSSSSSPSTSQLPQFYAPAHTLGPATANSSHPASANSANNQLLLSGGYTQMIAQPWYYQSMPWTPDSISVPSMGYAQHSSILHSPVSYGYSAGQQLAYRGATSVGHVGPVIYTRAHQQQNSKDHPPCNTLFIGNLGLGTNEWEIRTFFSSFPGFRQLKILRSVHGTTCFVEFQDVLSAAYVHQSMQGAVLTSSDRGGMRIQFSKNPYGCRGDTARSSVGGLRTVGGGEQSREGEAVPAMGSEWDVEKVEGPSLSSAGGVDAADRKEIGMSQQEKERTLSEDWQEEVIEQPGEELYSSHASSDT